MLSYLPEPSWLAGPPEPNPRHHVGTCLHCHADHYDANGDKPETSSCSCGAAQCCNECPHCSQCGDKVCPQCSMTFTSKGEDVVVCHACHQTYLDDLDDEPKVDPIEGAPAAGNAHVDPLVASILNAFIKHGVRA